MISKKNILVVDDSVVNRKILSNILSEEYSVLEAENGKDALDILAAPIKPIYAIMLDLVMPIMDGFDFIDAKAKIDDFENIPVIVITGSNDEEVEIKALKAGAWDFVTKPYSPEIIKFRLKNVIQRSQLAVFEQIKYLAEYDTLTNIYNGNKFFAATEEMLLANPTQVFAFYRFDINRFNLINSFFGIAEGDNVLRYIANQLVVFAQTCINCTYGRINADVFGVCLPYESVENIYENIKRGKKQLDEYNINFDIVLTCGIYIINDITVPLSTIYDKATLAAKQCKGNYMVNYAIYNDTMSKNVEREQEIINEMNVALNTEQFEVYLQPKYNLSTYLCEGAEALVRWFHPTKGAIPPNDFIPIFERNGFISKLDYYMWEHVCILLRKWLDERKQIMPISVNVSRVNLYSPNFISSICELTDKYNIPNSYLNLELTESAYMDNSEIMKRTMQSLHDKGFIIMMDDFGSGYSSLNILKDITVDVLKIDMRFLSDAELPLRSNSIIASVIRMAQCLGIPTIAEGVEQKEQADFLHFAGCEYAQGYYFAKPMSVDAYENLAPKFVELGLFEE